MEDPPKKFYRLAPGREVRLRYAYFITCREVIKASDGAISEIHCSYDPQTRGGNAPDGRKVQATLHWVSAGEALPAEVRIYNTLFSVTEPNASDFAADLNPSSLEILKDARLERALANAEPGLATQFERQGYFCQDASSTRDKLVFNRTIGLRDTWAKVQSTERT
jgi:glutaminyl-tRNA synthetase